MPLYILVNPRFVSVVAIMREASLMGENVRRVVAVFAGADVRRVMAGFDLRALLSERRGRCY